MKLSKNQLFFNIIVTLFCIGILFCNLIWFTIVKEPLFTDNYHDDRQYKVIQYDEDGKWYRTLGSVEYVETKEDYILVYDTTDKKLRKISGNSYFIRTF